MKIFLLVLFGGIAWAASAAVAASTAAESYRKLTSFNKGGDRQDIKVKTFLQNHKLLS
jgi:hypothetical protein